MPQDPVVSLLLRSPLSSAQRRAASEAFTASANEDELQDRMLALNLPKSVRAELWDLKVAHPPQAISAPPGPEGSALNRFASNAGTGLIDTAKGLWNIAPVPEALGGSGIIGGPVHAVTGILSAANDQRLKARAAQERGDYGEMAARSVAAAIPGLGPAAAAIGEQAGTGDLAGAAGRALTTIALPYGAGKAVMRGRTPAAVDALEREATQTVAQKVLAPTNRKYQPAAQDVAPELLKRGVQGDRTTVAQWADDLVNDAQQRIDDVIASYPQTQTLKTAPIVAELTQAIDDLSFTGPQGRMINPVYSDLATQLQALKTFVEQRGADMTFADMRRLRQQLDTVSAESGAFAKAAGDRSLSAAQRATMDTANAIRRQIAAERPELAQPNADMHLGLALRDILDPVKGRPAKPPSATTGATGGLHTTGAIVGQSLTNIPLLKPIAAFIMSDLLPRIREAQVSPQNQLRLAADKYQLAQALKAGKPGVAQRVMRRMALYVPGLSAIGRIPTEPAAASGPPR